MDSVSHHGDLVDRVSELYAAGHDGEAEALTRAALARELTNPELWFGLASLLLVQGKWSEGFQAFETRPGRRLSPIRQLPYPEWEGAPLAGRSILVCGEQGIGDEIMFGRFIPALRQLGASRISLAALPTNVRALRQLGADEVFPREGSVSIPRHDCWVMLASLPHRLGVTLETLSGAPYLRAEPTERGLIGVVERGRPTHLNDAHRSLPPGTLQKALPHAIVVEPRGDVLDSLAQVAGLDVLVTVDTSWAHMAGALGVGCRVLLPAHAQDWRWLRGRLDSPWYDSVRLYRQRTPGDWAEVIGQAVSDL
jgi:hypothetical protein